MAEPNIVLHQLLGGEAGDRIEIGTPGKGGQLKISGNFSNPAEFREKIDNAVLCLAYANLKLKENGI